MAGYCKSGQHVGRPLRGPYPMDFILNVGEMSEDSEKDSNMILLTLRGSACLNLQNAFV